MGKGLKCARPQELEEINHSLLLENVELKRLLEDADDEKRKISLMLQEVVEEKIGESYATRSPSKTKHADICAFFPHLKDTSYVLDTQNDILEASIAVE